MSIKLIISIVLIIFNNPTIEAGNIKWIEDITKIIQNDRNIYQVIFLINDNTTISNENFNRLITKLSKYTLLLEIAIPNYEKPSKLDLINYNPRISLFILMNSENDREFSRSFDFLSVLSESKRRPKCLLLLYHDLPNYRQFFETLWIQQFLDVTVIEVGKFIFKIDLNSHKENYCPDFKVIHYNPFLKLITNESTSDKTVWFPDKLKNMYGYPLVASLLHAPPFVFIPNNPSEEMFGIGVSKIKVLQEIMNFTLVESSITSWGQLTCSKAGSSGLGYAIYSNEIQIMGMEVSVAFCNQNPIELSKSLRSRQIGMAVPLIKENVESSKFQWHMKNIIIVMILPIFFWIISRILGFCPQKWKILYMLQITLGNVIPEEPTASVERILFHSFLFGCFMFSSDIYTSITQVQLETESSFKFESLNDVLASNIQILINENYFYMMNNTDDVILQQVLKKSKWMLFSQDECVERLIKYKNLSCILEVPRAELMLRNRKDKCGQPLVKFLNEKFPFDSGATQLAAGVPYAKRIDQVTQRIIDSGIKEKWLEPYSPSKVSYIQMDKSCTSEQAESVMMIQQLVAILYAGFGCSTFIFILELIMYYVFKK